MEEDVSKTYKEVGGIYASTTELMKSQFMVVFLLILITFKGLWIRILLVLFSWNIIYNIFIWKLINLVYSFNFIC